MNKELLAISTLVGTIVGVGIFGMPYAFVQSGFFLGMAYLAVLSVIVLLLHLVYGEVILRTKENLRFFGHARKYLGTWSEPIIGLFSVTLFGSLLAYVIAGGKFLSNLFSFAFPFSEGVYVLLFWFVFSLFIFFGLRAVAKMEFWMSCGIITIMIGIVVFGAPRVNGENFSLPARGDLFLPFGVVLFALTGSMIIPEMRDILRGSEISLKRAVIAGTLVPAVLYVLFVGVVVGISGAETSDEAIAGLAPHLGRAALYIGSVFGLLAVVTSYLALSIYMRDLFMYDLKIPKYPADILVMFIPILLYYIGPKNFIAILAFVGTVLGGISAVLTLAIFRRAKTMGDREPEYAIRLSTGTLYALSLFFLVGIVIEIYLSLA